MADLGPEGGIVLLVFRDDASLRSVTCNASKRAVPQARYLSAAPNGAGGQDGAFDGLDGANGNVLIDIEIDGADFCLHVSYLLCNLRWRGECLLDGGVQPPLVAMPDQLGASQLQTGREIAAKGADFDPGPARSGPDFEQDGVITALFPEASVERSRLLPGPGRNGRALPEGLLLFALADRLGFVRALARSPFFQVRAEGASRSQSGIDGGAAEHRRDIWRDMGEWQDGGSMLGRFMRGPLQDRERLFVGESQDAFMSLDTIEV